MAELSFESILFHEEKDNVKLGFMNLYYSYISKAELRKISDFKIKEKSIVFKNISETRARKRFDMLLTKAFSNLKNRIGDRPTTYVHRNSGIPLVGYLPFGVVDKNVSILEVKTHTNCNISCIFCSVDLSRRIHDFVVEKDYLVDEIRKIVEFKGKKGIEINLNPHGEPTLYSDLVPLVRDLREIECIEKISMNTNAVLLNEKFVDKLADAGFTRFNVSLNAIDPEKAKYIEGSKGYNIERVKEICKYIKNKSNANLLLAPVWVPGISDEQIPKLIEFAKELDSPIRIQNFQLHRFGKKPVKKEKQWKQFFKELSQLEQEHDIKLTGRFDDLDFFKTKPLPKPFVKGDKIKAEIVCPGELPGEMVAVSSGRAISVLKCNKKKGTVNLEIIRSKNNIFVGKLV